MKLTRFSKLLRWAELPESELLLLTDECLPSFSARIEHVLFKARACILYSAGGKRGGSFPHTLTAGQTCLEAQQLPGLDMIVLS